MFDDHFFMIIGIVAILVTQLYLIKKQPRGGNAPQCYFLTKNKNDKRNLFNYVDNIYIHISGHNLQRIF